MTASALEPPVARVPFGAWYDERELALPFPTGWKVDQLDPAGAPALDDEAVAAAFAAPIGTSCLSELARGRRSAVVAIDDLTRPTPVHRLLPVLLRELEAGGIPADRILVLIGTAAHRPPSREELGKKLGPEMTARLRIACHDFLGSSVRRLGRIAGGPVELDGRFLDAELRICVGGVIPHAETGFGGGAKMVVPGLAGHATIAHFHGALPPRPAGQLESAGGRDRRAWAEEVARAVGVDAVVCAVINPRRELAGLYVGDLVAAHRAAAQQARQVGRTRVARSLAERADVVVVNAYPLDTDPIQTGKSVQVGAKLSAGCTVVVNAASDGIFYHGMGMGMGVSVPRLLSNVPTLLASPRRQLTWLHSLIRSSGRPLLAARLTYFTLNPLSYEAFSKGEGRLALDTGPASGPSDRADPLLFSERFPAWGFRRRYRHGRLFRDWEDLRAELASRFPSGHAVVLPCAPLQLVEID